MKNTASVHQTKNAIQATALFMELAQEPANQAVLCLKVMEVMKTIAIVKVMMNAYQDFVILILINVSLLATKLDQPLDHLLPTVSALLMRNVSLSSVI